MNATLRATVRGMLPAIILPVKTKHAKEIGWRDCQCPTCRSAAFLTPQAAGFALKQDGAVMAGCEHCQGENE